jgi:hypothetical protein
MFVGVSFCAAQAQTIPLLDSTLCYSLEVFRTTFGSFSADNTFAADSTVKRSIQFQFACNMNRILEVRSLTEWSEYRIMEDGENDVNSFVYTTLGTDDTVYKFILESSSNTLSKVFNTADGRTHAEINEIHSVFER